MYRFQKLASIVFATVFLTAAGFSQVPRVINGGILNGKAVSLPKPEYPEAAKEAGVGGKIAVHVVIDEAGNIASAEADLNDMRERRDGEGNKLDPLPADPLLRDAAEKAALQAKFSPTLLNGEPVRVKGVLTYHFVPDENDGAVNGPKTVRGGVLNGKAVELPLPKYPAAAQAVKASGAVSVQVTVDEQGSVISASAVSGHPLLRAAAEAAAREAKFSPTTLSGVPVMVTGILVYNFVGQD
ncbi:MAG: TonB family protein [Pyrinomonadaceae bacterium]